VKNFVLKYEAIFEKLQFSSGDVFSRTPPYIYFVWAVGTFHFFWDIKRVFGWHTPR